MNSRIKHSIAQDGRTLECQEPLPVLCIPYAACLRGRPVIILRCGAVVVTCQVKASLSARQCEFRTGFCQHYSQTVVDTPAIVITEGRPGASFRLVSGETSP